MPIYEYRCDGCGHEMELIQKMSDDPMKDCPVCKESKLKKLISAAGFRLKGGGWYETDFKTGNKKNVAQGDKKPAASSKPKGKSGSTTTPKKSGGSS